MIEARLHDGSVLPVEVHGTGPVTVLLPVDPRPAEGARAEELRRWGVDPALGRSLVRGLGDAGFRVAAFAYEDHRMAHPRPDALTPDAITADLLAVADAAGAERFAFYGYSWLALSGLQLALRTDRLAALAMGGFPPLGGPYAEMLRVTKAAHAMAGSAARETPAATSHPDDYDWSSVEVSATEAQTRQFVTLYEALRDFDDRAALPQLHCPRLCFAGSSDTIPYGEGWGGVTVDIAGAVAAGRADLAAAGWEVHLLDGLDHTQAMQPAHVLPVLLPWLAASRSALDGDVRPPR
ncbi:alpha/beta hydrolase [Streptomyces huiliensis]|uniref:alpha/beta hydrolase n=1 Tax=Streptomyces huiliensis TaxID=2876027 RepID=UPI001CBFEA76|nr:alpha/beta hydrolase [Streptomyces huiliensis]MBZ4322037.1 alpha/beta hydrolase [Streptomyces huiliensis]